MFSVDVSKRFAAATVRACFAAESGLTVLFGPSGVGKSTVLNMIAGLVRPDAGRIALDANVLFDAAHGVDLPAHRRRVGYVFQEPRLFPHLRVRENLLYGHRLAPPNERWLALADAVRLLDIAPLLERYPANLSGGEARRVAIGRALLAGAQLLLMDEPLSFLDAARRDEILRVIERVRDELGHPILYVTHDASEAERLATRIVTLERDAVVTAG